MNRQRPTRSQRLTLSLALLGVPALLPLIARLVGWLDSDLAISTLKGIMIAAVGGLVTGIVEERLLRRPRNDAVLFLGIAAATGIGVLTIGYLYLVHIRGPMSTIGSLSRAVEQVLIFLQYLTSQGAGMMLSAMWSRERRGD